MARRNLKSSVVGVPAVVGMKKDISRALAVRPKQVREANRVAQEMGCGAPFRADGMWEGTRQEKRKYMKELNRRRANLGLPKLVNLDGGHGDELG